MKLEYVNEIKYLGMSGIEGIDNFITYNLYFNYK